MANFYAQYPGSASGSNASVAPSGGTAPTSATLVAGESAGLIVPVSVDPSGNVNVNVISGGGPSTVTANQGTPAIIANAWPIEVVGSGNIASVTAANAVKVDGSAVTQPVSASSLPLPAGAATSANQSTEITALGTINTTLGSPFQAGGSIGNTSFIATQSSGSNLHVDVDNFPATQPVSGTVAVSNFPATQPVSGTVAVSSLPSIPAGANAIGSVSVSNFPATQPVSGTVAATQSGTWTVQPGNTANTTAWLVTGAGGTFPVTGTVSVSNISTSSPVNTNGSFSQASISSASTITAPANAVGFLLEADSANTDWLRWTDSNSTASASNGMKLEPGRDTGFMPMKHNLSICPNTGTQTYSIQWVLSS